MTNLFGMNKKGFTLIEILVVIAIIGILSALALVSFSSARARSRDARRMSDLRQMLTALELYNNDQAVYPSASGISLGDVNHACLNSSGFGVQGCSSPYMMKVPTDPQGGYYTYTGSSTSYVITATLEGTVNNLSGTVHASQNGITQ